MKIVQQNPVHGSNEIARLNQRDMSSSCTERAHKWLKTIFPQDGIKNNVADTNQI